MSHHRDNEGICFNPNPNLSSLILIAKILGKTIDEMKKQYPIFTSCLDL